MITFFKSQSNLQPVNELYSEFLQKLGIQIKIPIQEKITESTKIVLCHGFGILNAVLECELSGFSPILISLDGSYIKNTNYVIHCFRYIRNISESIHPDKKIQEEFKSIFYSKNKKAIKDSMNYASCYFYSNLKGHYAFFYEGEVFEEVKRLIISLLASYSKSGPSISPPSSISENSRSSSSGSS